MKLEVVGTAPKNDNQPGEAVTSYSEEPKKISNSTEPKDELTPRGGESSSPSRNQTRTATKTASESRRRPSGAKTTLVTLKNYQPTGLFKVRLELPISKGYGVQVSAFTQQEGLFREIARLQGMGFDDVFVRIESDDFGIVTYKIILGNFDSRSKAESYKNSLAKRYKIRGFGVDLNAR